MVTRAGAAWSWSRRSIVRPARSRRNRWEAGRTAGGALENGGQPAMIIGAHSIIYSKAPQADRVFLQDVLELPSVDVGDGWLIFGLPPAEVAEYPPAETDGHELYRMC